MLEYSLHENPLTDRKDDYAAQAHVKKIYNREEFIDLMLQRGTLVTRTDIVAVLNNLEETAVYVTENGEGLNLPLINTGFSVPGVFKSILDLFDPNRHKLHVNVSKGVLLREAEKRVKLVKINAPSPQPQVLEVKDSVSEKIDEVLTSGGAVEIDGINIKLAGKKETVGLWFVSESDGSETPATTIVINRPAQVIALIPALTIGETYRIKIVTQYSGSVELKQPKVTVYDKLFTVT
jgi:hypothetical protein